jgi:hypothetical protein
VITRLGIDIQGEEKTSSEISLGPLAFREVTADYRDAEVSAITVPAVSSDYLLTRQDGSGAPAEVDFVLIRADSDFEVRVGSLGTYIPIEVVGVAGWGHAFFMASCKDADGIYVNTGTTDTKFRVWEAYKTP